MINHFFFMGRQGRKQHEQKMGKGNSSKVDDTKGLLTLGHSNWTIYSLLNWWMTPGMAIHFVM